MVQSLAGRIRGFFNLMLLLIFLLAIFAPSLKTLLTPELALSSSEKRKLAQLPRFEFTPTSLESFPTRFETYFDDHLGFRDQLIKIFNYCKVFGLEKSPVKKVLLGQNGWLYYTEVQSIEDYRGLSPLPESEMLKEKLILENRAGWLAAQGIQYLVVVAPNKQSIYPEFLPDHLTRVNPKTRMDRFQDYLAANSNLAILDLRPILRSKKNQQLLYHPTDTHWNAAGRFIAYQEIAKQVRNWFPGTKFLEPSDFTETMLDTFGDLSWMLHLQEYFPEHIRLLNVKTPCAVNLDPGVDLSRFQALNTAIAPDRIVVAKGCDRARLRVLVFRDSFFAELDTYLAESFSFAAYFWIIPDMALFEQLVNTYHPDIVMEERSERLFFVNLWTESKDIDALFKTRFEQMKQRIFSDNGGRIPGLRTGRGVTTAATGDGLLVRASVGDPQLYLPTPAIDRNRTGILKVVVESPQDTILQLFFQTAQGPAYFNEEQSLKRIIHKGMNELYLELTRGRIREQLRLDPGALAGDYLIRSLELRVNQARRPLKNDVKQTGRS